MQLALIIQSLLGLSTSEREKINASLEQSQWPRRLRSPSMKLPVHTGSVNGNSGLSSFGNSLGMSLFRLAAGRTREGSPKAGLDASPTAAGEQRFCAPN